MCEARAKAMGRHGKSAKRSDLQIHDYAKNACRPNGQEVGSSSIGRTSPPGALENGLYGRSRLAEPAVLFPLSAREP